MEALIGYCAAHPGLVKLSFIDLFDAGNGMVARVSGVLDGFIKVMTGGIPEPRASPRRGERGDHGGDLGDPLKLRPARPLALPALPGRSPDVPDPRALHRSPQRGRRDRSRRLAAQAAEGLLSGIRGPAERCPRRRAQGGQGPALSSTAVATDEAIRPLTRPRRVGHKGAAHLAQGNTPASFDAALAQGVDMIEFDVLSERTDGSGALLVAHDYEDMCSRTPLTLEQALEHLAGEAFAGIEFDLDVKIPGYELRVVDALRGRPHRADPAERHVPRVACPRARRRAGLRLGWSVPRVRRDYTSHMLTAIPALRSSPATGPCCRAAPARR